jgi:hypothetical protein
LGNTAEHSVDPYYNTYDSAEAERNKQVSTHHQPKFVFVPQEKSKNNPKETRKFDHQ